jgi:hypothetical protein
MSKILELMVITGIHMISLYLCSKCQKLSHKYKTHWYFFPRLGILNRSKWLTMLNFHLLTDSVTNNFAPLNGIFHIFTHELITDKYSGLHTYIHTHIHQNTYSKSLIVLCNIVTDSIKVILGNRSVNTFPCATVETMSKSKSHCDWRSVSQKVLVSSPIWGSCPDIYYCFDSCGLVLCGAPSLKRGRVYLLYMLLALPAQSFLGPSPFGLATVYYCLKFETSLFVASYDSQGHGGGIRPRLHTGSCGNCVSVDECYNP